MSTTSFNEKFKHLVTLLRRHILTVVPGDFNFDHFQCPDQNIVHYMNQLGFCQYVKKPTADYGSTLDYVYVSRSDIVFVEIVDTYYSDHDLVYLFLNLEVK